MTPREMLIGIDLRLQKVNSDVVSSISDEEKLWFLNEDQIRFIKQRTNVLSNDKKLGLQDTEKRYDDLEALIESTSLPVFARDNSSVFTYLPTTYFSRINIRSLTKDLCGKDYNPTTAIQKIYTTSYVLPVNTDNFYQDLIVKLGSTTILTVADYYSTGIKSLKSSFELINILIDILNSQPGIEAKYETSKGVYNKGAIIVSSNLTFTITNNYTFSGVKVDTFTPTSKDYTQINTITGTQEYDNRLVKGEKLFSMLNTNFSTTFYDSPITTLQKDSIVVYHKKKFILSSINLDYIRKPKKISLILNQGCELSENVHEEIVDNTAKRIAAYVLSQEYNNIINENLLKE